MASTFNPKGPQALNPKWIITKKKNHRGQQLACNKSRELPAKGRGEGGISLAVNEFMPEKV